MTLSIDQVRDCKFHLARRNGYEPVDVDNFVDQVEETMVALYRQIDELKGGAVGTDETVQARSTESDAEVERLRAELAAFREGGASGVTQLRTDLEASQAESRELREQVSRLEADLNAKDAALASQRDLAEQLRADAASGEGKVERLVLSSAPEASGAVTRLLEMATLQADELVSGAQAEADQIKASAQAEADAVVAEAQARRDRLEAEHVERKTALDTEITDRRNQLVGTLEEEQASLEGRVSELRSFDQRYRDSFAETLQRIMEQVKSAVFEPEDQPAALTSPTVDTNTPKLDALLADRG